MKASVKFREEKKPLLKAKVPISILTFPFFSAVTAGEPEDLRLDLVTAFSSGPSLRATYRPNDHSSPFSVSLRTGAGSLGSPLGAPISMSAEFVLGSSPRFSVLFKPRLGDFSLKKVTSSTTKATEEDATAAWVEKVNGGRVNGVGDLVTGMEVTARSAMPIRRNAEVRFKWGMRIPAEIHTASVATFPLLVMSKISIVHMARVAAEEKKGNADVAKWGEVAKQVEAMRAENGMLKKAVEEIRARGPIRVQGPVAVPAAVDVGGREERKKKVVEGSRKVPESSGRSAEVKDEAGEELRKALMANAARGGTVK